ncbi:ubiquitin carboxyl-terminal hydrolase 43a isoform X1 [Gadus chalcogrammus]|uniref:ubiquitin carboxyl-terminal hydrolase 43a isoform X1 n=2 Tax=Gadus chalcogrammus TaxID=1042646 RepID=UPI0024C3BC39|nr:ubiquitin carboxyl-terminal hydrolase 43a isoform X1 [Gadus chalcogrammus]
MDNRTENKTRKQPTKSKPSRRKEKKYKSAKLFRRKSLRSVGHFMSRILKTLGTLAHFGDDAGPPEAEDDDGGFRESAACSSTLKSTTTFTSGNHNDQVHGLKKSSTVSSHGSVKDRLSLCFGDKTPGVLGLKNHGNTCFMNAVVQCLSNTDLLAEYLGLEQYQSDMCRRSSGSIGVVNGVVKDGDQQTARGEVTVQLASLVRALWTLEYTPQISGDFKSIVSKYASQFRGNSQHDALEFLLWLLDRVHEDASAKTNGSSKVPSVVVMEPACPPALPLSNQPGTRHSFVQEHFQAQYRSSLTCPHCLKQSNTFDPFSCISLPIPLRQTRPLCVTLVFSAKGQRYLRVGLAVPLMGTLRYLRAMVAEEGKLRPDQVILSELYTTGFQRSFSDEDDLTSITDSDVVYAFQAPPLHSREAPAPIAGYHHSLPSSPYSFSPGPGGQRSGTLSSEFLNKGGSTKVLLLLCSTAGSGPQAVRFGPPFLMREDRDISWEHLHQSILSKLYYLMLNGSQAKNSGVLFKIRVVGGSAAYSYLSPQDGRPLQHPAVDRGLKLCGTGGTPHVKLVIEWEHKVKDCLFGSIQEEVVKDAESVRSQQQQHLQQHSCTLDECFQLYTKEEQLAPDDAWRCPHCKQLQQGMVKMSLWTLPDILILHLKRFRQVGERRNKLSTLVRFPMAGLDMAPHVVKRSQSMKSLNLGPWPPAWKPPAGQSPSPALPQDYLYDLYAVCNHHGGMHGGHYTAYCRNSVDGQWYSYDDSSVDLVPEEEVCTRGAYILFYQRRNTIPPWSASSSVGGSTSSSMSDHWLIRLTDDSMRSSVASRHSVACPDSLPDSPEPPVFEDNSPKQEKGRFESRPFERGLKGRSVSMRSPSKARDTLNKVLPLRWSFGSKDRRKPQSAAPPPEPPPGPAELVEYLESGRRPRCTKEPIVSLMAGQPAAKDKARHGHPGVGGLNCMGRPEEGGCPESPGSQVAEGQRRTSGGKTSSLRRGGKSSQGKGESPATSTTACTATLGRATLTRRKDSGKQGSSKGPPEEVETRWGSSAGVQHSVSTPSLRQGSLSRTKEQAGRAERPAAQRGEQGSRGGEPQPGKEEEAKGNDGMFSFLKGNFLKKDKDVRRTRHCGPAGDADADTGRSSSSRLSLSNGEAGGTATASEGRRSDGAGHPCAELPNGKAARGTADIKRSQSSSNIPSKTEATMRRTASLHRNGIPHATASPHGQPTDKLSHGTLQRPRHSTHSLGRKKTVPESSF